MSFMERIVSHVDFEEITENFSFFKNLWYKVSGTKTKIPRTMSQRKKFATDHIQNVLKFCFGSQVSSVITLITILLLAVWANPRLIDDFLISIFRVAILLLLAFIFHTIIFDRRANAQNIFFRLKYRVKKFFIWCFKSNWGSILSIIAIVAAMCGLNPDFYEDLILGLFTVSRVLMTVVLFIFIFTIAYRLILKGKPKGKKH